MGSFTDALFPFFENCLGFTSAARSTEINSLLAFGDALAADIFIRKCSAVFSDALVPVTYCLKPQIKIYCTYEIISLMK